MPSQTVSTSDEETRRSERHPSRSQQTIQKAFRCRICSRNHALRHCPVFLEANTEKRMRLVLLHKYCSNCLAHKHSQGSCVSKTGCHICQEEHHTMLHIHEKLRSKRSSTKLTTEQAEPITLSSLLGQQVVTLFPTAVVVLRLDDQRHHVRALIDPLVAVSRISAEYVEKMHIPTTLVGKEVVCRLTIRAHADNNVKMEALFKVVKAIKTQSPSKALSGSVKSNFTNMVLADPKFDEHTPLSLVLGSEFYQKCLRPGMLPGVNGLPVALNTAFGWILSGSCSV